MRYLVILLSGVLLSGPVFASAPIEDAPEKPAKPKKQVNLDTVEVNSTVARATPIIIPRDPGVKRDVNTAGDHTLDATEHR